MFTNFVAFIGMIVALGATVVICVWSVRNFFESRAIEDTVKNQPAQHP